jgi:hypothetical protein
MHLGVHSLTCSPAPRSRAAAATILGLAYVLYAEGAPRTDPNLGEAVRYSGSAGSVHPWMRLRRAMAVFLPSLIVVTALCGLIYVIVQQEHRIAANYPQERLAREAAIRLNGGDSPASIVGSATVDVGTSLEPFVVVFDSAGNVLATDGSLNGRPPDIPYGVLVAATKTGRNAVTWQPQQGVRVATVTIPWNGGTVLSGRSLRPVEARISTIESVIAAAWVAIVCALVVASLGAAWLWPRTP